MRRTLRNWRRERRYKKEELASNMWKASLNWDEFGNMFNVETLNRSDSMVFNHALNRTAKVRLFTVDPEDDVVVEIVTEHTEVEESGSTPSDGDEVTSDEGMCCKDEL